jgi:hypothetical protein
MSGTCYYISVHLPYILFLKMLHWIVALFGFEPSPPVAPAVSRTEPLLYLDATNWLEGPQVRKEI